MRQRVRRNQRGLFVYDFMMLPYHEQLGLLHKFGIEGNEGPEQTTVDFFIDAMKILKARGKIGELKAAVESLTESRKAQGWDNRPARSRLEPSDEKYVCPRHKIFHLECNNCRRIQLQHAKDANAKVSTPLPQQGDAWNNRGEGNECGGDICVGCKSCPDFALAQQEEPALLRIRVDYWGDIHVDSHDGCVGYASFYGKDDVAENNAKLFIAAYNAQHGGKS